MVSGEVRMKEINVEVNVTSRSDIVVGSGVVLTCHRHISDPFYYSQGKPTPGMHIIIPVGSTVDEMLVLIDKHLEEHHSPRRPSFN